MNILITGAGGFVGKNLVCALENIRDGKDRTHPELEIDNIFRCTRQTTEAELKEYCADADFVFHLAGVNRPKEQKEFMEGNRDFTGTLLGLLELAENRCPVMLSSSTQAALDNPYGESKRAGEQLMREYGLRTGARTLIYRFPNVFGKWCRPNYNSAVATFCHNRANDLPIQVNDRNTRLTLVYIDDVVQELIGALEGREHHDGDFCCVPVTHSVTLGEIVDLIETFREQPATLVMPEIPNGSFEKKLYSTFLSYLPKEKVAFPLKMNVDQRGSFTELLKTANNGQFSVNIMLPGYTHNIINLSDTENLVTLMWANEQFDLNHPDTFFQEV